MKKTSSLKAIINRFTHFLSGGQPGAVAPQLPAAHSLRRTVFAGATILAGLVWLPAQASTIMTQTFTDSWTVEPYFYSNQTSAWQWSYTPYVTWDSSLGTLTGVKIHTAVTGQREDPTESVFLRTSFFTGWAPDQFQYYKEDAVAPGAKDFSYDYAVSTAGAELNSWLSYDYLPQANYYFESRTYGAGHSINAVTTLDYIYEPVPPSSVPDNGSTGLILGSALAGLIALRRRYTNPSQTARSALGRA